jgi:SAM-dependent methyltransferase
MSPVPDDNQSPYRGIARFYDAIYLARGRRPREEVDHLAGFWRDDGRTEGERTLLDVGCGTGVHLPFLADHGSVVGLDRSSDMIAAARRNCPGIELHVDDLRGFDLGRRFDVVTCLFGAIGYLPDRDQLERGLRSLGNHVEDDGLLLVEPPLFAEQMVEPRPQHVETDFEGGTLVRDARSRLDGDVLEIDFAWRFMPAGGASPEEVRERHRLLMLDTTTWVDHMQRALPPGTRIEIDHEGPIGRGLLVARLSRDGARGTG